MRWVDRIGTGTEVVVEVEEGKEEKFMLVRPWFYWGVLAYLLWNFVTETIPTIFGKWFPALITWWQSIYG
jgi:hypothetical protein